MREKTRIKVAITGAILLFISCIIVFNVINFKIIKQKNSAKAEVNKRAQNIIKSVDMYLGELKMWEPLIELYGSDNSADFENFEHLAEGFYGSSANAIKSIQLAPDGIISYVYPYEPNKSAIGINLFEEEEQKKDAIFAYETGKSTISCPVELRQGGTAAIIRRPIYVKDNNHEEEFWGFAIVVLDLDVLYEQWEVNSTEDAGYRYKIWYGTNEEKTIILQSDEDELGSPVTTDIEFSNVDWKVSIQHKEGWIDRDTLVLAVTISLLLTGMCMMITYETCKTTEQKKKDEQNKKALLEAENETKAKSEFLFNMSHDIRTPMNAIVGFSDMLVKYRDDDAKFNEYIDNIKSSSKYLMEIIDNVLEMARIESGTVSIDEEICDYRRLLDETTAMFEEVIAEKNIEFKEIWDVSHKYVYGDETKIKQIYSNLISNSIKYTNSGGHIEVSVEEIQGENNDSIILKTSVKDDGIGITSEFIGRIYQNFAREKTSTESKVSGTGLGMAITKNLVELMDGTIEVDSEVGKGATVTVCIPHRIAEISKEETKNKAPLSMFRDKRVLLAEDNELNTVIATDVLEDAGFIVEHAGDGVECVDMLKKSEPGYYDVILMDIQMPNMDGYNATRAIREFADEKKRIIPIVAITANIYDTDRQNAAEAGMDGFIIKPIETDMLYEVLGKILK